MNEELVKHLTKAERIVIFTGAGISTASGIPDALLGAEYIRCSNDAKFAKKHVLEFDITRKADIYIVVDKRAVSNLTKREWFSC